MIGSTTNISIKDLPLKSILKAIIGIFSIPDVPVPPIDPITILDSVKNPGISSRKIAAEINSRLSEACAPFGPLPSGAESIGEKVEYIRADVYKRNILENAKVTVSVPPGIISVGTVITPLGPLPVVVTSVTPAHPSPGIIQ